MNYFIKLPTTAYYNTGQFDDEQLNELINENTSFDTVSMINVKQMERIIQADTFCTIYFISGESINTPATLEEIEQLIYNK